MCEPTTIAIAGTLASAAGTYMQTQNAAKDAKNAMNAKNQAYAEGINRQNQYADESAAALKHEVDNQSADNFNDQREQAADEKLQAFNDVRVNDDYQPGVASTPKNVVIAQQRAKDATRATTDRDAENLFNLTGYDSALFNQGLERNNYARAFGNLSDTASRDAALIGMDVTAAGNNAKKSSNLFPTLLKTAGSAANLYGSAGYGFGGTPGADSIQMVNGVNTPVPLVKPTQAFGGYF